MTTPLKEIREALAKATPGPWRAVPYGNCCLEDDDDDSERGWQVDAPSDEVADTGWDRPYAEPDAALIAAAPAWLAELVDRVEAAEARVAELESCDNTHRGEIAAAWQLGAEKGAADAQAAIVTWLRGRINPHEENPNGDIDCASARQQGMHDGWWVANDGALRAIGAGDHLPPPGWACDVHREPSGGCDDCGAGKAW